MNIIKDKWIKLQKWNTTKFRTHIKQRTPWIHEGEIWWCRVGENIGIEINGKHEKYLRPVYIFKKLNRFGAIVIPLTSQAKVGSWYYHFTIDKKDEYLNFAQIRTISVSRFENKLGSVKADIKAAIKENLLQFLR